MTVRVEVRGEPSEALRESFEALLRARVGVEIKVVLERPGALAEVTGIESRQKPIRLVDKRSR
jgi:phenylacetate-CoA ligase